MSANPPERNPAGHAAALYAVLLVLVGMVSFLLWGFTLIMSRYVTLTLAIHFLPNLTEFIFDHRLLLLLFPIPWLFFAIYSGFRGSRSNYQLLFFSSTLILAMLTVSIIVAFAVTMPLIPR